MNEEQDITVSVGNTGAIPSNRPALLGQSIAIDNAGFVFVGTPGQPAVEGKPLVEVDPSHMSNDQSERMRFADDGAVYIRAPDGRVYRLD